MNNTFAISADDNVFLSGADAKYLPASYTLPPGSVAALKGVSSWVTTVSPKVGINLAPVLNSENLQTLSFVYAPDFAQYYDAPSENNNAHRFGTAIKGQAGAFSLALENNLTYVDGDSVAPTYPGGLLSAIGIAAPRERRPLSGTLGAVARPRAPGRRPLLLRWSDPRSDRRAARCAARRPARLTPAPRDHR